MLESDMTSDRVRLLDLAERAASAREERPAAAPAAPPPQNAAEKIAAAAAAAQAARNLGLSSAPRAPRRESAPEPQRAEVRPVQLPPAIPIEDIKALAAAARASMEPGPLPPLAERDERDDAAEAQGAALEDGFADDMLLEPGTGRPAVLDEDAEAVDGDDVSKAAGAASDSPMSNFIASARMAAKTAGATPTRKGRKAKVDDTAALDAPGGDAKPHTASAAGAIKSIESRRRPILLGLAALVVALGTVQIVRNVMNSDQDGTQATAPMPASPTAPAGPEQKSELQPNGSGASLLNPKSEAAGSFGTQPAAPPSTQAFTPTRPREPETVGAINPSQPPAAAPLTGETGRSAGVPMGDIPAGALPAALQRAAGTGDAAAEYEVASRYFDGRGMTRDPRAAAKWFERAATQGFAPAQYRLGSMYEKGLGVPVDVAQARIWYRQAADRGNAKAMHNLGVLIAEGSGGKPDYEQAAIWFRRAADLGVRDSQYNLAILTARGLGVQQNLAQSYTWFSLAAAQGDEDAARKRVEVAGRLDAATLASAKSAAETFRPARLDEAANETGGPAGGWDAEASAVPGKAKAKN